MNTRAPAWILVFVCKRDPLLKIRLYSSDSRVKTAKKKNIYTWLIYKMKKKMHKDCVHLDNLQKRIKLNYLSNFSNKRWQSEPVTLHKLIDPVHFLWRAGDLALWCIVVTALGFA